MINPPKEEKRTPEEITDNIRNKLRIIGNGSIQSSSESVT